MYDPLGSLPEFDSEAAVITSAPDDPEHRRWRLHKGYGIKTNKRGMEPQKHSSAGRRAGGLSGAGQKGRGSFATCSPAAALSPVSLEGGPAAAPRPEEREQPAALSPGRPQPRRGPFPPKGAGSSPQAPGAAQGRSRADSPS